MEENHENQQKNSNYTSENPGTDHGRKSVADDSNTWENLGLEKNGIEGATISGAGGGPGTGDPDTGAGADVAAEPDLDTEAGSAMLNSGDSDASATSSGIRSGEQTKNARNGTNNLDADSTGE